MEDDKLIQVTNSYFESISPPYVKYDFGKNIPLRKLNTARKIYAPYNSKNEQAILLIDDTVFSSAKRGILLTDKNLFFRLYSDHGSKEIRDGKILLNDLIEFHIDLRMSGSNVIVNGNKVGFTTALGLDDLSKKEAKLLNRFFDLLLKSVHSSGG